MKHVTRIGIALAAFLVFWATLLAASEPGSFHTFVLWLPFLLVVALGVYLLGALVYGVATFRSVPEEAESLQRDIARARAALAAKGL